MEERHVGLFLKERRLALGLSITQASKQTGVSNPYISQVESGLRRPGPDVLKRLAPVYGVSVRELLERAGHLVEPPPASSEPADVERAYQFVLADPRFHFGTRPEGDLGLEAKRFIVEMYEALTGKRLL